MKILIVNAGSSSLKYQVIDMTDESTLAKGLVERIGIQGSKITQISRGEKHSLEEPLKDHVEACKLMLRGLTNPEFGVIKSMDEIGAVGHRVLHGGERFTASAVINDEVMDAIEENIRFGPLHNPANLMGIRATMASMPGTPMVAVFDTSFHQTMPPKAFLYGIPMKYYRQYHLRRYGFHGTSHMYVSQRAAQLLGKKPEEVRLITCHLGNGSSVCAVAYGKCVDTSMGLTPLEGVLMGTRSGSVDPAVLQFIMNTENYSANEMLDVLNKKSGFLGLSGVSSDMRDVEQAAADGNEDAKTALDVQAYGVKKYIGAYAAAMGGVDAIVFTAGIGENSPALRARVMENMEYLGAGIDLVKNEQRGKELDISAEGSKVRVLIIPTDEEIMIARDTMRLVTAKA